MNISLIIDVILMGIDLDASEQNISLFIDLVLSGEFVTLLGERQPGYRSGMK